MSMTKFCPREVSRAKDSISYRSARRFAWGLAISGWAILLWASVHQAVAAMPIEECVARCEPSVVLIQGTLKSGTGFVVAPGIEATNRHVIDGELLQTLRIRFPTPHKHPEGPFLGTLQYVSAEHDIAFLAVKAPHPPLHLADAASLRRGQQVLTIGNPGLGDQIVLNAIATGNVSSEFLIDGRTHRQISMQVHPGNSGGPILDQAGGVVGMLSCRATEQAGIAFCIPADTLQKELVRAQRMSAEQSARLTSRHQLRVVSLRYLSSTASFLNVCQKQILSRTLDNAELAADGPGLVAQASSLSGGCREALAALMADEGIPAGTKKPLQDLATLPDMARDAAGGPRGPMRLYVLYFEKLAEEFGRVAEQVKQRI
jgi:S1-C subfamily serine protease